jgi:hypothetical protein
MSITATAGTTFEATADQAPTGLVGTIGVQIQDGQGTAVLARHTTGIVEAPAGSGIYTATMTAPAVAGQYVVVWDTGGVSPVYKSEDLAVTGVTVGETVTTISTDGGMERIVRGQAATLTYTFPTADGVPANPSPDAATVTITRADGTAVVTDALASDGGTGIATYTLTPAQTALLDVLTVTWTATYGGQPQAYRTTVEVVGGVLFTIAELRAESAKLANTTDYLASKITQMRTTVEKALEKRLGFALVPRYSMESAQVNGGSLSLRWPYVRAIRSVTTGGSTVLTSTDLAGLTFADGALRGYRWPSGYAATYVGYEHGKGNDDPEARQAALTLAKMWLLSGPVDDRALGFANEGGSYALATPGRNGAMFAPAIDEWIQANRLPNLA